MDSPPRLCGHGGPPSNPVRVDGKKLFKFDIGDVVEVKYKHPRRSPQNAIQKQLVGKKLKGRVVNFHVSFFLRLLIVPVISIHIINV